ncbi:hypothetical protein BDF14DRAFT_1725780 [Spinellus fusiger]|nr:hypothetical protein BDF14DRAFT_1725780 [Spinellus fusiger]
MAVVLPFILIGAPVGYFTWTGVFDYVDHQVLQLKSEVIGQPTSGLAASIGTLVSGGVLAKTMFSPTTRYRLFFATPPPHTNIRVATLKMGLEFLMRSGAVFYGGAAGGAISGRVFQGKERKH